MDKFAEDAAKYSQAAFHALRYGQAVQGSEWLKDASVIFGDFTGPLDAYALTHLYNALDRGKPDCVVEFGLGESSKLVHQYAMFYEASAVTVESDESWIKFYTESYPKIRFNVEHDEVVRVTRDGYETDVFKNWNEPDHVRHIGGFERVLVAVDAPTAGWGRFSRTNVLTLLPYLEREFCIFIHDTEREGESYTANRVLNALLAAGRQAGSRAFMAAKGHTIIASRGMNKLLWV